MITEHPVNLLSEYARLEGTIDLNEYSHFNGEIKGTIRSSAGSTLIIGEQGVIEGTVSGDTIIIDGFVRGEIKATTKVLISETGRVVGNVKSPCFAVLFGGYFEGRCTMKIDGEGL